MQHWRHINIFVLFKYFEFFVFFCFDYSTKDDDLNVEATAIYEKLGIDLSTAVLMFLKRTVTENGISFPIDVFLIYNFYPQRYYTFFYDINKFFLNIKKITSLYLALFIESKTLPFFEFNRERDFSLS